MSMSKTVVSMRRAALLFILTACNIPAVLLAQTPDLSGVYYPMLRDALEISGATTPGSPPPRPTQTSPLGDGRQGREGSPRLTPEYMAKWEIMRKTREAGSSEFDNFLKCLPLGMPSIMLSNYPMEMVQNKDKIILYNELNDSVRRIYLDGRKPTPAKLDDPTYAGYASGHWEGDTLVVDTAAIHTNAIIESISIVFTPHSDAMTVRERIRLASPDVLEDRITVTDPKAFTKPWEIAQKYRRAKPGSGQDELREFACAEGFGVTK